MSANAKLAQSVRDIDTVLRVEGADLEIGSRRLLKEVQSAVRGAIEALAAHEAEQAAQAVPDEWTRRMLLQAATAIEMGPRASLVMNVEGVVDNLRRIAAAPAADWERELSAVMPQDFKDWWENSRSEWPAVAAEVIRSLRADCELGWKMAAEAAPAAEPLTDDDAYEIASEFFSQPWYRRVATEVVRATERAHGIGGATTGEQR